MCFFEKYPKLRLIYCIFYLLAVFASFNCWFIVETQDFVGRVIQIIISIMWLFGIYISFVKAGIVYNKHANAISNFKFDAVSIVVGIYAIDSIIKLII